MYQVQYKYKCRATNAIILVSHIGDRAYSLSATHLQNAGNVAPKKKVRHMTLNLTLTFTLWLILALVLKNMKSIKRLYFNRSMCCERHNTYRTFLADILFIWFSALNQCSNFTKFLLFHELALFFISFCKNML